MNFRLGLSYKLIFLFGLFIVISVGLFTPIVEISAQAEKGPCFIPDATGYGGKVLTMNRTECSYWHGTFGATSAPAPETIGPNPNEGPCFIPDASGYGGKTLMMTAAQCSYWHGTFGGVSGVQLQPQPVDVSTYTPNEPTTYSPSDPCLGKICNPLGPNGVASIPAFIEKLLIGVVRIGMPIIALAIIYCGFLFVQARGKPEAITKAKDALLYTLIGAAILLGSWAIAGLIANTVLSL